MRDVAIETSIASGGRAGAAAAAAGTLATVLVLSGAQATCLAAGVDAGVLVRDTAAVLEAPFYTGVLSNVGGACWGAATALGILGSVVLRRGDPRQREVSGALRGFALLSAWLGLDDLVQIHEYVAPRLLGIDEQLVYLAYALLVTAWIVRHRRVIVERAPLPLLVAFIGFGGSLLADELGDYVVQVPLVLEDGLKLIGVVNWGVWAGVLLSSEVAALELSASRTCSDSDSACTAFPPPPRSARRR